MAGTRSLATVDLGALFEALFDKHGPQGWWPAETPFEMMVGAVLVQNTNWRNVEQSIAALNASGYLDPAHMYDAGEDRISELIRPSGFMTAKSHACVNLAQWVLREQPSAELAPTPRIRQSLLGLRGIGPETADVILLYVFHRRVFIADAYARRLLTSLGFRVPPTYEKTRMAVADSLQQSRLSPIELGELHALIVAEGKTMRPVATVR